MAELAEDKSRDTSFSVQTSSIMRNLTHFGLQDNSEASLALHDQEFTVAALRFWESCI